VGPDTFVMEVEGEPTEELGDPRVTVLQLNKLLARRPDLGRMLQVRATAKASREAWAMAWCAP
jgi:hypothetical protein